MKINCAYTKLVPIAELIPNPRNPNKHPARQIELLAKILNYQGWRSPIVVSTRTGFINKGHARLEAAQLNKFTEVPVDFQDYESEAMEYADMVADNKIAELAEHDDAMMIQELENFPDLDTELLGLDNFQFPEEETIGLVDEDEIPEKVEPRTKPGDLYKLGNHRLLCGDSLNIQNIDRLMGGEKADMVFTDPPYGMNLETDYKGSLGDNGFRTAKSYKPVHGDNKDFNFLDFYALVESIPEQFWWGADYYCQQLPKEGSWFVWNKRTTEGLQKMYGNHFELCWSKTKHQREIAEVAWAGAFGHNKKDDGPTKVHPTMKAIKLIEWFFGRFKGDSVLDIFGGSGSTLIACEKTNRKCFMMELDPHYCDVIVTRWEKFTGKKASLVKPLD